MKYTIDDLRGKYVKVGTPECDEFLKACVKLNVRWCSGSFADIVPDITPVGDTCVGISILFDDDNPTLGHSREAYWVHNGFVPFEPKTDTTSRTAESSAVETLESLPDTMTIGEMVDSGQSVFGGRITQCDDVDDTTQRTAESSAVKTLESLGYVWNGGEQWKPPVGKAPSYITDDVDDTVTQHGERYGLFADGAKYERTLVGLCGTHVKTDVYRVLDAFNTGDPILDHLIKKALCAGLRGHKDKLTDYRNIVESAEKALKLLEQKQNGK